MLAFNQSMLYFQTVGLILPAKTSKAEMLRLIEAIAEGLLKGTLASRRKIAWTILAMLAGGVALARAVNDPKVGAQIADAVTTAAIAVGDTAR